MRHLRAIFVAVIAFSLTALPVAAAEMRGAMMAGLVGDAGHAECCPGTDHCEKQKQTKDGCDGSGLCWLKCSVPPATSVAALDVAPPLPATRELAVFIETASSALEHPPLPPPRV